MVSVTIAFKETVASLYVNRVTAEQFFSAPHSSVVGLKIGAKCIDPVMDGGRSDTNLLLQIAAKVCRNVEVFAEQHTTLQQRLEIRASPLQIAWPFELLTENPGSTHKLPGQIENFDAWGRLAEPGIDIGIFFNKKLTP